MREILIFAGTTEGRTLSECLAAAGISHTLCVATEYGEIVCKNHPLVNIHCGRMNREEIREYVRAGKFAAVVDATHPYAEAVTENIRAAMEDLSVLYLRLERDTGEEEEYDRLRCFESNVACAEALQETEGNILLTTGSKELAFYCASNNLKNRLYVRVLPGMESLRMCMEQGITGKQIIALQGPFSAEMNEAMLSQYQIKHLVTKRSGRAGGYEEKVEAARKKGIPVYVIEPAKNKVQKGQSFGEVCAELEKICGRSIAWKGGLEIILAGVGMGAEENLTTEVRQAIREADILFGAKRMLDGVKDGREKKPFYRAEEIIPCLKRMQDGGMLVRKKKAVVLFSGDSGFNSGCPALYKALQKEIQEGELEADVHILPGISSVSYLAACIGESYEDAEILSIHGKKLMNLANRIRYTEKCFLLMAGVRDVNRLGELLINAGMEYCTVYAGYQLSYPRQQIRELTPKQCAELTEEGLYICFIKNPQPGKRRMTHGRSDAEFIRDKVPMTKEEVREVSICKLRLWENAIVYDIGSGTGSIAIEMAALSENIQVYAIEHKKEAVALIEKNKEKSGLENIEIISAEAPGGFAELPVPTHAFIGGSGGRLREILDALYQKNPHMRIVMNAVSLETICEIKEVLASYPTEEEEVVQLQVSRSRQAGAYHLMQAENPVWICAFSFYADYTENIRIRRSGQVGKESYEA